MSWFNKSDERNYCGCGHNQARHTLKLGDLLMCFDCTCAEFTLVARDVSAVIADNVVPFDDLVLEQDINQRVANDVNGGHMHTPACHREGCPLFSDRIPCACDLNDYPHFVGYDHRVVHDWGNADPPATADGVDMWLRERGRGVA